MYMYMYNFNELSMLTLKQNVFFIIDRLYSHGLNDPRMDLGVWEMGFVFYDLLFSFK